MVVGASSDVKLNVFLSTAATRGPLTPDLKIASKALKLIQGTLYMSSIAMVSASHSPLLHCHAKEPQDWDALQAAMKKTAQWVKEFDPELVVAFGSDHFNGFFLKMMPSSRNQRRKPTSI